MDESCNLDDRENDGLVACIGPSLIKSRCRFQIASKPNEQALVPIESGTSRLMNYSAV